MTHLRAFLPADIWMRQIFEANSARDGGIVWRSVRDVERMIGREAFVAEITRRGFHIVENSGQFVIFCNNAQIRMLC